MTPEQQRALLTLALFAAFADGRKAESEREAIRGIAKSLTDEQGGHPMAALYQDVLLKRVRIEDAVAALDDPAHRQLAYEMAVCVCDADGTQSEAEHRFLVDLAQRLGLSGAAQAQDFERQADAVAREVDREPSLASAPAGTTVLAGGAVLAAGAVAAAGATAAASAASAAPGPAAPPSPELDKTILNYAILNGALELLPQSWASIAIIPLQIKMVYRIGKAHGVELDQGHIKEFIAAAGVGLTSQYLEQFGRKLIGGLLGKAAGRTFGRLGSAATGMAFSFATTYALGHVARRYYAGGRVMSTELLRNTYQDLLGPARQLQTQYLPQIRERAQTLDAGQVMSLVRGNGP